MTQLAVVDITPRWLALCGLDGPNADGRLISAARADLEESDDLRLMLQASPAAFRRWWYEQDHNDWLMTAETGNIDWAWLVLARAGFEVQQSQFSALT